MKKFTQALLFSIAFSSTTLVIAAPMKPESVDKLIKLTKAEEFITNNAIGMDKILDQQAELVIKKTFNVEQLNAKQQQAAQQLSQVLFSRYQSLMKSPKLIQAIKDAYQKTYTEEEAQAYIAFLSTPMGQSIIQKSPQLGKEMMQQINQITFEMMDNLQQRNEFKTQLEKIITQLQKQ